MSTRSCHVERRSCGSIARRARQHRVHERHRMPEMRRAAADRATTQSIAAMSTTGAATDARSVAQARRAPAVTIARVNEPWQQQRLRRGKSRRGPSNVPAIEIRAARPSHGNDKRPRGSRQRDRRFARARCVEPERRRKRDDRRKAPSRTDDRRSQAVPRGRERAAADRQRMRSAPGPARRQVTGRASRTQTERCSVLIRAAEHERRLEGNEQPVGIDPLTWMRAGPSIESRMSGTPRPG